MSKHPASQSDDAIPAILTDTTLCTGCEKCVAACKSENDLNKQDRHWRGQQKVDGLSSTRFCAILRESNDRFVRHQCRHCKDPACVSACLVGAMQKSPEGPVIYDENLCMGCRYCMVACPYGIPRYDWDRAVPLVRKCTMCYERLQKDKDAVPACVDACPEKATIFGSRKEMLEEAHRRLEANPDRYHQHVYGEHEVGGTSVLYISDAPLDFLPNLDDDRRNQPLPALTGAALSKVPGIILGMGGLMLGVHWTVGRRMKVALQAGANASAEESEQTKEPSEEE
jgi:formate dehydrogenase iron-sulfur subunit